MIIRKPYAILIRYFKVIHIALFVLMVYLLFATRNIYTFFKDYLLSGTYTYKENMVASYINPFMIIITILLIVLLLSIFFLMKEKKKPTVYYLISFIFYIIMFIALLVFYQIFISLDYNNYGNQSLVIFRDLWMVLYYGGFYFFAISFIRGFGFNVKKFNFEKDIKELNITEEDREEVELTVGVDYESVTNFIRREKRHFTYYLKENSFILIIFLVLIALITSSYFALNKLVINKVYKETQPLSVVDFDYVINKSYITNKDKFGKVIIKDKYYIIVDFNVTNKTLENKKINYENMRVKVNDNYYYPKTNVNSKFNDLGTIYKTQYVKTKEKNNYILIFEVDKEDYDKNKNVIFEVYNYTQVTGALANLYYKEVKLSLNSLEESDIGVYQIALSSSLDRTIYENGNFVINSYEIDERFSYKYTKCDNNSDGNCTDYSSIIMCGVNKTLLKLSYTLDSNSHYDMSNYVAIRYTLNNKEYFLDGSMINNKKPDNYTENDYYFEVDNKIKDATKIEVILNIRGTTITYILKEV